jgi:hypothetical protein
LVLEQNTIELKENTAGGEATLWQVTSMLINANEFAEGYFLLTFLRYC